jgi:hypothetical protein
MRLFRIVGIAFVVSIVIAIGLFLLTKNKSTNAPTLSVYQYIFKRDGPNLTLELLLGANNNDNIKQVTADLTFDPDFVNSASITPLSPHDKNPFFIEDQIIKHENKTTTHILYAISGKQAIKGIDIGKIGTLKITMKHNKMPTPLPDNSNYADGFVHTSITMSGTVTATTTDGKVLVDKFHEDTFAVFLPYL